MHGAGGVELGRLVVGRRHEHRPGDGPPELAGEALDGPVVDDETEPRRRDAEHARRRRHAQVAGHGELRARAERRTVDGGDRRDRQLGEAAQDLVRASAANSPSSTPVRSAPALNAGGAPVRTSTRASAAAALGVEQAEQRGVVDRVAALGPVERDDEHPIVVPRQPYHAANHMSERSDDDPIRRRRAQVARWTLLANRVGYVLLAVAVALFFAALILGFSATMATLVIVTLVAACVLLAPRSCSATPSRPPSATTVSAGCELVTIR